MDGELPAAIPLRVAESASGGAAVAAALAARSWVVIAVDPARARAFRECARLAAEFFEHTPARAKASATASFADAGGRGLAGYNAPHAAKEVLRCRRGLLGAPPCPVGLRGAVLAAFGAVERVALAAWRAAAPPGAPTLAALGAVVGDAAPAVSASPFDLMYYPNGAAAAACANSTPHVDAPGLVTCVPVAATPGLRVRDRAGGWVDVERRYRPFEDVVVFADAALQALSRGAIRACEHEVAKAGTPRLSLVYELRPSMEVGRALLERGDAVID
jgi:hypothetical protein